MIVEIISAACALLGLLFLWLAMKRLAIRGFFLGSTYGLIGVIWLLAGALVWVIGLNLTTYQRLTFERPAAELQFKQLGPQQFSAALVYPTGAKQQFELRGDEWQMDARLLKWQAPVNVLGFDSAYRLERLSGRYTDIASERAAPRTVHALQVPAQVDAWELARRYKEWLPWVDALYGSATFLPMADGALFEVKVTQSGLVARPLNQAARQAVGSWR